MPKITIIDIIGDTIFIPKNDPSHYKNKDTLSHCSDENMLFNEILFNEKKKYDNKYNTLKDQLRKELINRNLLIIKTNENKENIKLLIDKLKSLNYSPKKCNIDNELEELLTNT
tara:strand:+ start:1779 stop:2120 length:342 start_codon:yes stop_codon:yes gene_type:complete